MLKDEKVFIAQRGPEDRLAFKWEFPGGKLERGESPEECLKREMKEEFGIEVSVGKFFAESIYTYKHGTVRLLAYMTDWKSGELNLVEHQDCRWITVEELAYYELAPADMPLAEKLRRKNDEL
jgi:8-oxo-dGTP diphosphatase